MIFITGATGNIGSELTRLLIQGTIPARAMCRKAEQSEKLKKQGIKETALADFDDPESMFQAMLGCKKLFLLTHPDPRHAEREISIIETAIQAGIQHIVRISTGDANLSARLPYAKSHAEIDHYLRSKNIGWTIIRPTGFMQNFIESAYPVAQGKLPHLMGEGQISYIDLRDIARVAKHALTENGHQGATYFLTGPESMTMADVASRITVAMGHQVNALNISEEEMRKMLGYADMSLWDIDALIEQFTIGANGCEIDVTEEVKRITGQPARTFNQFLIDYKNEFLKH